MSYPEPGTAAPDFNLPSSTGENIKLSDFAGRHLVLYFYPRADTPGCTTEACGFRDSADDYEAAGVNVVGVSPDPETAVTKFADKYNLTFPLLADEHHTVCEAYGVWQEKSMYGKKYLGAARTTFVIDGDGQIVKVFEKVKPKGHEQEVLEAIQSM
jgi:peroxiredoxin Q/BCP